jgi:hypothetical protein
MTRRNVLRQTSTMATGMLDALITRAATEINAHIGDTT